MLPVLHRLQTIHEVLLIIEDDVVEIGKADVYILLPENGQNSDEGCVEDDCVDVSINNLSS